MHGVQTMASYIHFKLGAIEAIAQGHVSRARLLDTERYNFTKRLFHKMDGSEPKKPVKAVEGAFRGYSSTVKIRYSLLAEQNKIK